MEFTKRHNLNRGYMKLEVWQDSIELFKLASDVLDKIKNLDFKLRSQLLDAAQSISSNISEGYCRRSLNEYLYFLNVALGSCGELLTRFIGLRAIKLISSDDFENLDSLHFKVENKLLALIKSLQSKRQNGNWDQQIHESKIIYKNRR